MEGAEGDRNGVPPGPAPCQLPVDGMPASGAGVQKNAILRDISGHLSRFLGEMRCFRGQVPTFIAPVAVFLDTCLAGREIRRPEPENDAKVR